MTSHRVHIAIALAASLSVAACSSGESVITSGNDPEPTAADADEPDDPAGADEPADDATPGTEPDTDGTDSTDSTEPAESTTTTTTSPLAGLPGCPTEALDSADGPVEITFWHGLTVESEAGLQALAEQYNAAQDRVRVVLQNQGSYLDTIDEYYQSSDAGRPNVVMFPEYVMQQAIDSGTVLPAAACIESSGFDTSPIQPAVLEAWAAEGVLWGMPFNVSVPVLYYRKDLLADASLDLTEPPATFEELQSYAASLAGISTYGLAIDSDIDGFGGWYIEQWFAAAGEPFVDNDNGRSGRATEVYFDGEFGVELLTYLQDLVENEQAVYVGDNPSATDHFFKMVDPGRPAAMTIGTSGVIGSVIAALGSGIAPGLGPDDVGIGPLPNSTGEPGVIVGGAANYLVAGKSDAETAAAWDFLTYLVEPENQSQWTVTTGYMPLRDDALEYEPAKSTFEADPRFRVAYDQMAASADGAGAGPLIGPHRQVRNALADAVAAIMTGADVAESLSAAADLAEAYLADYNLSN